MNINSPIYKVLFIVILIGLVFFVDHKFGDKRMSKWLAIAPDKHLSSARMALDAQSYSKSVEEIETAVQKIHKIELFADSASRKHLDDSIEDLLSLEDHIKKDEFNVRELNLVFAECVNSLAFTYLKIAQDNLMHGKDLDALESLRIVISHLHTSMSFLNKETIEEETYIVDRIVEVMDSLQKYETYNEASFNSLFAEVEALIEEEHRKLRE